MIINRIYYGLKPILPAWLRTTMRRVRARKLRKSCAPIWPIYEPSGLKPEGWPGWPEGKQFAFVFSHDVEGAKGLDRCRQLAEIKMEYGFSSSFHFIPKDAKGLRDDEHQPAHFQCPKEQETLKVEAQQLVHMIDRTSAPKDIGRHQHATRRCHSKPAAKSSRWPGPS